MTMTWRFGQEGIDRVDINFPTGTAIHVSAVGDYNSVLWVRDARSEPLAVFNEWAYAEVIKEEVTFVRHEDGVLVPPAG